MALMQDKDSRGGFPFEFQYIYIYIYSKEKGKVQEVVHWLKKNQW